MLDTASTSSSAAPEHATGDPRVSILVVSYNTRELTLACLASVFAQTTHTPFELIVIDNASTDNSADAIEQTFGDRIHLIRSEKNLGFAGANNLAATHATGDLLLLLNPDTVVLDHAIDSLVEFSQSHADALLWGGRTVFADHTLNPGSCWEKITLWSQICQATGLSLLGKNSSIFNPEGLGGWERNTIRQVDIVSGCFLLITRTLWKSLEGFDPAFFMYGEDADLCLRARKKGATPLICPDATIIHHGGKSEKVRADKVVRLYRAKVQLMRRHMHRLIAPLAILLQLTNVMRRWVLWKILSLLGKPGASDTCAVFAQVWKRKNEWIHHNRNQQ